MKKVSISARAGLLAALALAAGTGALSPAIADDVADFYRGRLVQVVIGNEVGGGYDVYGRLVGRFLAKHLPGNPHVIAQNMVGAEPQSRQLALQSRAAGWQRLRGDGADHSARSGPQQETVIRCRAVQLDRQPDCR